LIYLLAPSKGAAGTWTRTVGFEQKALWSKNTFEGHASSPFRPKKAR